MSRPVAFFAGATVLVACSGSDSRRRQPLHSDGGDAAVGAGGRGTGGRGAGGTAAGGRGTGGAASGGGGVGGAVGAGGGGSGGIADAGAGGSPEAGPDASSNDAAPEAEAGVVCRPWVFTDSGAVAEGGVGEWRDWAANTCRACPSPDVECDHFVGPSSIFDFVTRRLTFVLAPGIAEIHLASVSFYWEATLADGGFDSGTVNATMTVDGNTLTVDLSADIPSGLSYVSSMDLDIDEGCERHWFISEFHAIFDTPIEAGVVQNIFCEQ